MSDFLTAEEGREMHEIINGMRAKLEKYGEGSVDLKKYEENMEARLLELDKKNENLVQSIEDKKKETIELEERIKHLETLGANYNGNLEVDTRKEIHTLVNAFCKKRWNEVVEEKPNLVKNFFDSISKSVDIGVSEDSRVKKFENLIRDYQKKASADIMRTDINEFSGFLCPPEFSEELLRLVTEVSPVRRYARVRTIGSKQLLQPIRTQIPVATWEGETEEGGSSIPKFDSETFIPYRLSNTTPITYDDLQTNAYNVANELMEDNRLAFAKAEGYAFVRGNNIKQPQGFTTDPYLVTNAKESATSTIDFDDLIDLASLLVSGYDPMYTFNRGTLGYLRKLKDSVTGAYVWLGPFAGGAAGAPATINGYRYSSEFIDMDDVTVVQGYPIAFVDFARFYTIVDRASTIIIRDEFTRAKEAIVNFTLMRWTYGKPVIKEAGILLKRKAA